MLQGISVRFVDPMKKTCASTCLSAAISVFVASGPVVSAQILYSDNFDTNTAGAYTVNQDVDSRITFLYDYAVADGIPAAPNSVGGTTLGVKFEANIVDPGAAQALNISPIGQSFTDDYTLRFDMWINANGPFPAGGTGSTQFITAGVGTVGASVQKSSGTADGAWFAVDGEGNSSIDFRAYRGIALEGPNSTAYTAGISGTIGSRSADNPYYHGAFPGGQQAPASQQTAFPQQTGSLKPGTVGFLWHDFAITKTGNDVSWTIDGLPIATLTNATLPGGNIFVGFWDVFASVSDNPALSFGLVDNVRVIAVPETSTGALGAMAAVVGFARRRRK